MATSHSNSNSNSNSNKFYLYSTLLYNLNVLYTRKRCAVKKEKMQIYIIIQNEIH